MRSDPNGYDWRALGYSSLEAFIESKAGASPPDESRCIVEPGEHEWKPWLDGDVVCIRCAVRAPWPEDMPKPPPFAADDENDDATQMNTQKRVLDYRPETPLVCEHCGAPVHITGEERGQVYLSGPADMRLAAPYGITTEGPAETIWNTYECDNGHPGPVLFGDPAPRGDAE